MEITQLPQNRILHLNGAVEIKKVTELVDRIIAINKEEIAYGIYYEKEAKLTVDSINIHMLVPTDSGQIGVTMKRPQVQPIELHINSTGGALVDGLALVNMIRTSDVPVIAYVHQAQSMAVVITLVCDKIYTYPDTMFMIHELGYGYEGKLNAHKKEVEHSKYLQRIIDKIIIENSEIPYEDLLAHYESGFNWYLFGNDIRDFGLTNEIIPYNGHRNTTFIGDGTDGN